MPDYNYQPTWVPETYADRVARNAVLVPLKGGAVTSRVVARKTLSLVDDWRDRLDALAAIGWYPTRNHDNQFVRNCLPAFVYASQRTRPCAVRHLCPFCYARSIRWIWENLDECFPNPRGDEDVEKLSIGEYSISNSIPVDYVIPTDGAGRSRVIDFGQVNCGSQREFPYHMITVKNIIRFPLTTNRYPDVIPHIRAVMERTIRERKAKINGKDGYKPLGATQLTTMAPHSDDGFEVVARTLMIVEPDKPNPDFKGRLLRTASPTRKKLFKAVRRICQYPKSLMYGDIETTKDLLNAKRGHEGVGTYNFGTPLRMFASYGVFRRGSRARNPPYTQLTGVQEAQSSN